MLVSCGGRFSSNASGLGLRGPAPQLVLSCAFLAPLFPTLPSSRGALLSSPRPSRVSPCWLRKRGSQAVCSVSWGVGSGVHVYGAALCGAVAGGPGVLRRCWYAFSGLCAVPLLTLGVCLEPLGPPMVWGCGTLTGLGGSGSLNPKGSAQSQALTCFAMPPLPRGPAAAQLSLPLSSATHPVLSGFLAAGT